jgi:hypothetical protein
VEAVATRVIELMREGSLASRGLLVDAATLAAELGVTRSWIYEHRDELGVVRLGTGTKPRLRFDVDTARRTLTGRGDELRQTETEMSAKKKRAARLRRRPTTTGSVLTSRPRSPT